MYRRSSTQARYLAAALATLSYVYPIHAAKLSAANVSRAVVDFTAPDRYRVVTDVHAASDGSVWIVGLDHNWGRGSSWLVRRLSNEGTRLSADIELPFTSRLPGRPSNVLPIGTLPDGSLGLFLDDGRIAWYLAKVSPGGATDLADDEFPFGPPFMDRDGLAHFVSRETPHYAQLDVTRAGLPMVRSLRYSPPVSGSSSVPDYARWLSDWRNGLAAIASEGQGRMLIAACVQDSSGSFLRLYRVDAATLAILDSGRIDLKNDVYRSWSRTKIPQAAFVPAPSGGYWLFLSTLEAPPSPTTVAVRLRRDLEVIRPTTVVADEERPLSAAPMDALVVIECPRTRWEWDGSRTAWGSLRLLYTGFGSDGRLYRQVFEDSMTSHRLE